MSVYRVSTGVCIVGAGVAFSLGRAVVASWCVAAAGVMFFVAVLEYRKMLRTQRRREIALRENQ
jgi:hypothetical protein